MRFALSGTALALVGLAFTGLTGALASPPRWRWNLPAGVAAPVVPADNAMSRAKVELGRRLFYAADLSADGTMSCGTCHEQHRAFTEGNATHPGVTGERGRRNVPGLANVAWFSRLTFADPTLGSLEAQVAVPVLGTHPVEMGMAGRETEIAARLGRDPCYRAMFAKAFPETGGRIDFGTTSKAIASFERTLVSFGSAYDRGGLPAEAKAGQAVFVRACAGCHAGPNFTDQAYHRIDPLDPAAPDTGLAEKTGKTEDLGKFRTPSLRNVALGAPYWHDGTERSLAAAIDRHRLSVSADERGKLVSFLEALTDTEFVSRKSLALPATACGRRL
jgi:cytochrome c peroxidase